MTRSIDASIYLIRHAQSEMNTNPHLIGGRSNETPLTQEGVEQARRLGNYFLSIDLTPDVVYTSPARRTQETATHSLSQMGMEYELLISDEIQELGQGHAEGTLRAEVYTPEVLEEIDRLGKDFKLPGGESMNDVGQRMYDWIDQVVDSALEDPATDIFVYTHGGAITYLASRILGWSHAETYAFQKTVPNTSVSKLIASTSGLSIDYLAHNPN